MHEMRAFIFCSIDRLLSFVFILLSFVVETTPTTFEPTVSICDLTFGISLVLFASSLTASSTLAAARPDSVDIATAAAFCTIPPSSPVAFQVFCRDSCFCHVSCTLSPNILLKVSISVLRFLPCLAESAAFVQSDVRLSSIGVATGTPILKAFSAFNFTGFKCNASYSIY